MCNLYNMTAGQAAIRALFDDIKDNTGNLPALEGIYPDTAAPIVRKGPDGLELTTARWGMPSPQFALKGKRTDKGITNIRNTASPHWRRWLGPDCRCVVPFTAFSEYTTGPDGKKSLVWFAQNAERPLMFFAGIWTRWTSVRKLKEGETTNDIFGFLTCEPNSVVEPVHPKAMPVILDGMEAVDIWLHAPTPEALTLQRPLDPAKLQIMNGA